MADEISREAQLSLEWENVNLKKRTGLLPDAKNGTCRDVPLSSVAVEILRSIPRSDSSRVFLISMEAFKQALRYIKGAKNQYLSDCIKKGRKPDSKFMVGLRFHDLRHKGASRLFELGLNVMEVASITGHKTLQMLQRYTHLRDEDLARKLG